MALPGTSPDLAGMVRAVSFVSKPLVSGVRAAVPTAANAALPSELMRVNGRRHKPLNPPRSFVNGQLPLLRFIMFPSIIRHGVCERLQNGLWHF